MQELLNNILRLARPEPSRSDTFWHQCRAPILPKKTITGGRTSQAGACWRRWNGNAWEYQQDPETEDEYYDRQY